jgi:hypothetical protein
LACRTSGGSTSLYASRGEEGAGVLRQTATDGTVTDTPLRTLRFKELLIADQPAGERAKSTAHAAMVTEQDGKRFIRLGSAADRWMPCE